MLMQVPVFEKGLKATWEWLESLPEVKRQQIRSRFGVPRRRFAATAMLQAPDEVTFQTQTASVFFSIQKARDILGYSPRITFQEGMHRVEQWLRFANQI